MAKDKPVMGYHNSFGNAFSEEVNMQQIIARCITLYNMNKY